MKSLLLLIFLSVFSQAYSQEPLDNSSQKKDVALKAETGVDKDLSLELGSEKMSLVTRRSVDLLSSPGTSGIVTGKMKKGVEVQQLDIIGNYYLVCHDGRCGYVSKDDMLKVKKLKPKRKARKDSTAIIKSNKS